MIFIKCNSHNILFVDYVFRMREDIKSLKGSRPLRFLTLFSKSFTVYFTLIYFELIILENYTLHAWFFECVDTPFPQHTCWGEKKLLFYSFSFWNEQLTIILMIYIWVINSILSIYYLTDTILFYFFSHRKEDQSSRFKKRFILRKRKLF